MLAVCWEGRIIKIGALLLRVTIAHKIRSGQVNQEFTGPICFIMLAQHAKVLYTGLRIMLKRYYFQKTLMSKRTANKNTEEYLFSFKTT